MKALVPKILGREIPASELHIGEILQMWRTDASGFAAPLQPAEVSTTLGNGASVKGPDVSHVWSLEVSRPKPAQSSAEAVEQ